jgi:hypothetical protein
LAKTHKKYSFALFAESARVALTTPHFRVTKTAQPPRPSRELVELFKNALLNTVKVELVELFKKALLNTGKVSQQ